MRLEEVVPQASQEALNLIASLLQINPQKRPTSQQVIQHEYFQVKASNIKPLIKL